VLFVDLDNFKHVNDTFGHAAGDQMLCAIADSLRRCIRSGDTVARIGGDEFAVLLEILPVGDEAQVIASRIAEHIARPIRIGRAAAQTTASIGIAVGVPDRDSAESLLDEADHAMYEAKRAGKRGQSGIRIGTEPLRQGASLEFNDAAGALAQTPDAWSTHATAPGTEDFARPSSLGSSKALRYLRPKAG
jgi:diguanylate cyclase (GGDEF)-like protein